MYILLGILGFLLCIFFDFNKIRWHLKGLNFLFPLGNLMILGATVWCILLGDLSFLSEPWSLSAVILSAGAAISLILLVYTLFFALPFDDTYLKTGELPLVTKGVYGLCRHPGFWPFLFFYGFLAGFLRSGAMGLCCLSFSACNLLYIWLQDRYIFPAYIRGYREYRQRVPFLIPTGQSIRTAFPSLTKPR